jgi:uncharacterized protein
MRKIKIIWDEPKRNMNIAKHGIDFAHVTIEFFADAMFVPAKNARFMAIGSWNGQIISVVFTPLGTEAISIISARPASIKERKLYAQTL